MLVAELCMSYPWTPEYVWELPPRVANYFAGRAGAREARETASLITAFHTAKPREVQRKLLEEARRIGPKRPLTFEESQDNIMAFAQSTGASPKTLRGMRNARLLRHYNARAANG